MSEAAPRRRRQSAAREALFGYALLLPGLALLAAFAYYPLYRLVRFALYRPNRFGTGETYVGLSNVTDVLGGQEFRDGLWITVKYLIYTVPTGLVLGLLLALAAHRKLKGIKVFQGIFSSTVATSVAVASVVFFGLVNPKVGKFGNVAFIDLSRSESALRGVALTSIWQNIGLTFVIVLAGLQAIPDQLREAALLDGFGPVRRLFRVTLPLLSPTLMFLVVVLMIFGFQAFAPIELLTQGGPAGSTETLVFKIFRRQDPGQISEGSVMALGLFALTFVVTLAQLTILNRRVHYGD
ncbi:MAG TPA: sugar ABC transporter permease [Microthrixaceae bacterium]|jgi:sn-glycerol 3-phosphate transport system permease protein|nr:sugar ABC transporter permease [Microthrixaceae bacterium]